MVGDKASMDGEFETPPLSEHPTIDEIDRFFRDDTFAYKQADCRIIEAWKGHGVAEMVLDEHKHFNAQDHVMGGAIFTLADYAFAAASMCGQLSSVTLTCTMEFMKATKGSKLTAICDVDQAGRRTGFYTTTIVDDLGVTIAKVVATCYHPKPLPPTADEKGQQDR